ncbi:MAG: gamma-glutamyl-gamma-aminobutyrate hydrolase family protein [Chloroflexi bacterium]|nr:gamma-glutamyl-gamma-aminobutyrate hydrolase family protein [Chloroflexota bacterium]
MAYPLIGVTTYQGKNDKDLPIVGLLRAYVDALVQAGGVPVLIPSNLADGTCQTLSGRLDGILFTGGGDIAFDRFNSEPHPRVGDVDAERDSIELSLLDILVHHKKPFLGICRGFQVINVELGGTLYTHIEDQMPGSLKHDYYPDFPRTYLAHKVKVEGGTFLANILGETDLSVNSLHHQGAKDIPATLKAAAFAPDGLVEAVELLNHPFGIAVQWHPEWLIDQPAMRRLFRAFVEAASSHR